MNTPGAWCRRSKAAPRADREFRVPDETIFELQQAGLLRALQPRAFGGYEVDPRTFFEIQMILAEGCMSTAWIYGVMGVHPWQLARYPIEAQRDVWSQDHTTLISSTYMPVAKVTVVEGGYRISGRWGFSSGSEHCQWCFLGGVLPADSDRAAEHGTFLIPRSDYRIEHNWDVLACAAPAATTLWSKMPSCRHTACNAPITARWRRRQDAW